MRTVLNPAPVPALEGVRVRGLLAAAEVITPNRVEALALAGMPADTPSRIDGGRGPPPDRDRRRRVVVTLGADGCLVADGDDEHRIDPHAPGRGRGHGRGRRCVHRRAGGRARGTSIARRGRRLGVRRRGDGRDEARGASGLAGSRCHRSSGCARRGDRMSGTRRFLRKWRGIMYHRRDAGWCVSIVVACLACLGLAEPRRVRRRATTGRPARCTRRARP